MKVLEKLKPWVRNTPTYSPGRPVEDVARDWGLKAESIIKLASNENPLGPSPKALEAAKSALREVHRYPDGGNWKLRDALAELHQLDRMQFIFGNGSNEVLEFIAQVFLQPGDNIVVGQYAFVIYKFLGLHFGAEVKSVPMPSFKHDFQAMRDAVDAKTKAVFLASPNNPTGAEESSRAIYEFAASLPDDVLFVFDEAYAEYLEEPTNLKPLIRQGHPIICLRTFSKIYGLGGFRLGYGYGPKELIHALEFARQPFNTNSIAQAAGLAALQDHDFVSRSKEVNAEGANYFYQKLDELGLSYVKTGANFVLIHTKRDGEKDATALMKQGVIVRPVTGYGLADYLRVSIGTHKENVRFFKAFSDILQDPSVR